jgi:hypothetical protein
MLREETPSNLNEGNRFIRNVTTYVSNYTASLTGIQQAHSENMPEQRRLSPVFS